MTIDEIRKQLKKSKKPVAKSFHTGEHFKVLLFGFNKGMELEYHKAYHPTKLLVLEGEVIYKEKGEVRSLKQYDEVRIPTEMIHSVEALSDSIVLLTQG
ncbi:MAG: hypothetical protein WD381_01225 [Balneolaceae bacterium]